MGKPKSLDPLKVELDAYLDRDTQVGLPTRPDEFAAHLAGLRNRHSGLTLEMLVRDTHLVNGLWCLADTYPDGRVLVTPTPRRGEHPPPHEVGTYLFVGGTALVTSHRIGERISDDLDLLFIPHPDYNTTSAIRNNGKRIGRAAAPGIGGRHTFGSFGQTTVRAEYPLGTASEDTFIKMDVVPKIGFADHLDLLGVETHQITSLAGRYATAEQLAHFPQLGGFEMPTLHPAYTATTKFDALHHRAARGDERSLRALTGRARDIYDLYSIATSDRADEVRERIPAVAEITIHDFMNRGEFPRPSGGYANSPVFHRNSDGDEALRLGVEYLLPKIVWGHLPTYEELVEGACSLDSR